jgi:rhodanese-related sulfurtransferase
MRAGALLIDIRSEVQRDRDGIIPGSRHIVRNVFEWRCDPTSDWRDLEITDRRDRQLIVICNQGYQSSLAAATLQQFGFTDATDVIGGHQAWVAAGLQVHQPATRRPTREERPRDAPSLSYPVTYGRVRLIRNTPRFHPLEVAAPAARNAVAKDPCQQ